MSIVFNKETSMVEDGSAHTPNYEVGGKFYVPGKWLIVKRDYLKKNIIPACDKIYLKLNPAGDKILEMTVLEKQKVDDDITALAEKNADSIERTTLIDERITKIAEDELISEGIIDAKL